MTAAPVVIVGGARTPVERFGGALKDVAASDLAGVAIAAALERAAVAPEDVDEVITGRVGQVGADAYNARRCSIAAAVPVRATAMNAKAAAFAHGVARPRTRERRSVQAERSARTPRGPRSR